MALFASILVLFLSVFFAIASMSQCRKPSYWMGRRVARSMNLRHRKLTRWGFSFVSFDSSSSILDVGCGGGQTVREIGSSMPNMRVVGLDYTRGSISVAS